MSAVNLDAHDRMRTRGVNRVARGEQAPMLAHEYGTVSPPPSHPTNNNNDTESKDTTKDDDEVELKTAPNDIRFPCTNQTRHCCTRYLEYHKLGCIQEMGENALECGKFADYYRSLCPVEWIQAWNDQRAKGIFPGPI